MKGGDRRPVGAAARLARRRAAPALELLYMLYMFRYMHARREAWAPPSPFAARALGRGRGGRDGDAEEVGGARAGARRS